MTTKLNPDRAMEVYPDKSGAWRWRVRAGNGKVTAISGESFASRGNAMRAARKEGRVIWFAAHGRIAEVDR